jgi:PilZ domain-containing protein
LAAGPDRFPDRPSHKRSRMEQSATPRRLERSPVDVNAFVHCRGQFQAAKIIDYSAGGLRLEGTFGLIPTDHVQIELMSGARVAGRVAWSVGAQTGIVFSESLPANHSALIELSRRADHRPRTTARQIVSSLTPYIRVRRRAGSGHYIEQKTAR